MHLLQLKHPVGARMLQDFESEGVRLVREGRPARLAAVMQQQQQQQQGHRRRDQQQQLQEVDSHPAAASDFNGSLTGHGAAPQVTGGPTGHSHPVQQRRDDSSAAAAGGDAWPGSDRASAASSNSSRLAMSNTGRFTGRVTTAGEAK